jgi:hypothetical protein
MLIYAIQARIMHYLLFEEYVKTLENEYWLGQFFNKLPSPLLSLRTLPSIGE